MRNSVSGIVERFRQPQYTGENRCIPCTAVNTVIALALGVGLAVVATPLVGALAVAVSLAAIYLRGYLVPGTPELTKRYFPDWLLAWFDKGPERPGAARTTSAVTDADTDDVSNTVNGSDTTGTADADPDAAELDPEEVLSRADAVEPCADEDDLCLTASFESAWNEEMRRLRDDDAQREALAALFETEPTGVSIDTTAGRVAVLDGDQRRAVWPSRGALVADLAADRVLADRAPEWAAIAPERRFGILAGLRSFLDACPLCDGPVQVGEETVESCCRSWSVLSVHCTECDTELLELDPETLETVA